MNEASSGKGPWVSFLIGMVVMGVVIWLAMGMGMQGVTSLRGVSPDDASLQSATSSDGDLAVEVQIPSLRIAPGGRLALEANDLPEYGDLTIALELSDDARGEGPRSVRIVSATAGRLDAEATPLRGSGSGIRLEIDRDFLSPGVYLVEVDTADHHPLRLRRYVLEIK